MKILAITGLHNSGKSQVVDALVEKGFFRVGFNDVIMDELARRGLEPTQENER